MSIVLTYVGEKALDLFVSKFKDGVIERWTRHRASLFMDSLLLAVGEDEIYRGHPEKINELLDKAMKDDGLSSTLFDSYRRVCLSASRDIGPRIIGYLTALLMLHNRPETEEEDVILRASENMTDLELLAFTDFLEESKEKAKIDVKEQKGDPVSKSDGEYKILFGSESSEIKDSEFNIGPVNLAASLGSWAGKAEWIGLLRQEMTVKEYDYGVSRHDEPGTIREYNSWLICSKAASELAYLVRRYQPDDQS